MKLCINLIDQLFVIPLSNYGDKNKNQFNIELNKSLPSSTDESRMDSNQPTFSTPERSFDQQQLNCNLSARRSPPQQTPPSSPPPFASTPTSRVEDMFLSSSPPRASSSPIALHKNISAESIENEKESSSYCEETYTSSSKSCITAMKNKNTNVSLTAYPKANSTSIEGSLGIRPIINIKSNKMCDKELNKCLDETGSHRKESDTDTKLNSNQCASTVWATSDPDIIGEDNQDPEKKHDRKNGDTPTEVFKVAALCVT